MFKPYHFRWFDLHFSPSPRLDVQQEQQQLREYLVGYLGILDERVTNVVRPNEAGIFCGKKNGIHVVVIYGG